MNISDEMIDLVWRRLQPSPFKSTVRPALDDLLAEQEIRRQIQAARCRACPLDCPSCTLDQSDCECYEHQDVPERLAAERAVLDAARRAHNTAGPERYRQLHLAMAELERAEA